MKSTEDNAAGCAIGIATVLMIPIASALYALALRLNWNWFMVPLGVPAITTLHAYGLVFVASALVHAPAPAKDEDGTFATRFLKVVVLVVVRFAVLAGMGWGIHAWMVS